MTNLNHRRVTVRCDPDDLDERDAPCAQLFDERITVEHMIVRTRVSRQGDEHAVHAIVAVDETRCKRTKWQLEMRF